MNPLRGCAEILLNEIPFEKASVQPDNNTFYRCSARVFPQYSGDEIHNIYDIYAKDKTVFDIIHQNSKQFLDEDTQHGFVCKEGQGLRWRSLFSKLGQDIFTTALLSNKNTPALGFTWKPVIDIRSEALPVNMKCPENHFHLNGSTQIFMLSFLCVMNHIGGRHKAFKQLAHYYNSRSVMDVEGGRNLSLYEKCRIAAAIRLYLFSKVSQDIQNIFDKTINGSLLDIDATDEPALQRSIESFRITASNHYDIPLLDYAMSGLEAYDTDFSSDYAILAGERHLLYLCFRNVFNPKVRAQTHWTDRDDHFFYVYLILKNIFRGELIQTNNRLGFMNFSDYQDRKELFIANYHHYKQEAIKLAVNDTLNSGFVSALEARICPKKTSEDTRKEITGILNAAFAPQDQNRYKFSLVLHFVKSQDKVSESDEEPRDSLKRRETHSKARAIAIMLANQNRLRQYVRGIDACSNEIGCRPEVFAPSFRYLMNKETDIDLFCNNPIPKLNATYHVGEDFLDITDGLRAIDEVLLFMGFDKGNRLGHALALGINAEEYYRLKKHQLILSKQDLLDNIIWLIQRSKACRLPISSALYETLNQQADTLSTYIYGSSNKVNYYRAWRLRGDDPYCYMNSCLTDEDKGFSGIPNFSQYFRKNPNVMDDERLDISVSSWYYRYHFDGNAKRRSAEKIVFSLDNRLHQDYIRLVTDMQNQLLMEIRQKGVFIESNPTSNFSIGTLERYENHPIFRFFSIGDLPENSLCVSVNTDDLGVFDTSLQNEYALLAAALHKRKCHSQKDIDTYLKSIQNFGEMQIFR